MPTETNPSGLLAEILNTTRKILFIGHEATQTGAPLLLLELIRWLKVNSNLNLEVLLKKGGGIGAEYEAVVPVKYYPDLLPKISYQLHHRVLRKLKLEKISKVDLNKFYPAENYPVVYINTIAALDLAEEFDWSGRRCILHIHELEYITKEFKAEDSLRRSIQFVSKYITASDAVRRYLEKLKIPAERISTVHEFAISYLNSTALLDEARLRARALLKVDKETFVVGMCGTFEWRKGVDIFLQLSLHLKKNFEGKILCFWLGGNPQDSRVKYDIEKAGLADTIHIEPATPNPQTFYPAFDVFALTSREDPFPVAMLEAAASGLPIIAFENSGGAPEFIEDDAGKIIPYLDVESMADEIRLLAGDPGKVKAFGLRAREKVLKYYNLEQQAAKLLKAVNEVYQVAG